MPPLRLRVSRPRVCRARRADPSRRILPGGRGAACSWEDRIGVIIVGAAPTVPLLGGDRPHDAKRPTALASTEGRDRPGSMSEHTEHPTDEPQAPTATADER